MLVDYYRPQRSCGQGYVFTCVCDSVHRGGLRAGRTPPQQGDPSPLAGRTNPPGQEEPPRDQTLPWQGEPPPGRENPPWAGRTPPPGTRPPWQGEPPPGTRPPDGKQTPPYGLQAAGTHLTGMHSSFV